MSIEPPLKVHHKPTDDLRGEEAIAQSRDNSRFQLLNGDRAVGTRLAGGGLAAPAWPGADEILTTDPALHQTTQQMLRPLGACQRVTSGTELSVARSASFNLSFFDPVHSF